MAAAAAATRSVSRSLLHSSNQALKPPHGVRSFCCSRTTNPFLHDESVDPIADIHSQIASERIQGHSSSVKDRSRKIVLLGPPGVGKGTYGRLLSEKLGAPHISTGDLIRAEMRKRGPQEMEAMKTGKLLGDDVVLRLLWERLSEEGNVNGEGGGYVLDGVPRTETQAVMLEKAGVEVDVALNFRVADEDAMVAKCMGRRVCSECGRDYNLADVVSLPHLFLPARLPPPSCACKLRIRDDDACESIVRERLQVYSRNMAPVELHYQLRNKLFTIDVGPGAAASWPKVLDAARGKHHSAVAARGKHHSAVVAAVSTAAQYHPCFLKQPHSSNN